MGECKFIVVSGMLCAAECRAKSQLFLRIPSQGGKTALDCARERGKQDVVRALEGWPAQKVYSLHRHSVTTANSSNQPQSSLLGASFLLSDFRHSTAAPPHTRPTAHHYFCWYRRFRLNHHLSHYPNPSLNRTLTIFHRIRYTLPLPKPRLNPNLTT